MADAVISTELQLLGSKEYKAGLNSIANSLNLLKSELRASQSAFEDQDGLDALKDRLEGLNKVYDKHKEKVAFIAKQLDAAKQKYGENDTRVMELQKALNNATVAMNKCGKEIADTEGKIDDLSKADEELTDAQKGVEDGAKKSAKQLKKQSDEAGIGEKVFGKLGSAMGTVAKASAAMAAALAAAGIAAVTKAAKEAAKALIQCAGGSAQYADDLLTLSAQTGVSTEQLQKWTYASKLVDVDVETITGSMAKMIRTMGSMDKAGVKASDAITKLGLTIYNEDGGLKDSESMFSEIIYALGQVGDDTERDALAMEIFGRSAQELNPLIKAGSKALKEYGAEAERAGYVLSEEALAAAGEYQDSLDRMTLAWTGFKNQLGVLTVGLFKPFVDDATSAVQQVNGLLQDGWQEEDGVELTKILSGALEAFMADARNLWTSLKPVVETLLGSVATFLKEEVPKKAAELPGLLKDGVGDLTKLLKDTIDEINWEEVGTFLSESLEGLVEVFTGLVESLPSIVEGIDWSAVWDGLKKAAMAVGKAVVQIFVVLFGGLLSKLKTWVGNIWVNIKDKFDEVWAKIEKAVQDAWNAVMDWLIEVYNSTLGKIFGKIGEQTDEEIRKLREGNKTQDDVDDDTDYYSDPSYQVFEEEKAKAQARNAAKQAAKEYAAGLDDESETVKTAGKGVGENINAGLDEGLGETEEIEKKARDVSDLVITTMEDEAGIESPSKVTKEIGGYMVEGLGLGLDAGQPRAKSSAIGLINAVRSAMTGVLGANGARFAGLGKQIAEGLAAGLSAGTGIIRAAAEQAAMAAYTTAKEALGIHSPSKLFEYLGEMSAEGFTQGIGNLLQDGVGAISEGVSAHGAAVSGIDYALLGNAVADALRREGVGEASIYMDGEQVGRLTERGVSRESYRRASGTVKGRSAGLLI